MTLLDRIVATVAVWAFAGMIVGLIAYLRYKDTGSPATRVCAIIIVANFIVLVACFAVGGTATIWTWEVAP